MTKLVLFAVFSLLLIGCATAHKANDLAQGMTQIEVREKLGNPNQTQFMGNKLIWKYTLLKPWTGYLPYYLVFDPTSQRLESWYMNESEFQANQQQNQQQWMSLAQSLENQKAQAQEQRSTYTNTRQGNDSAIKRLGESPWFTNSPPQTPQNVPKTYRVRDQNGNTSTYTVEPE